MIQFNSNWSTESGTICNCCNYSVRSDFSDFITKKLPNYAQPVFIRIIDELETTGTFKLKKGELRNEAYHLDKVNGNKIYVKKPGEKSYSLLDEDYYKLIINGDAGF